MNNNAFSWHVIYTKSRYEKKVTLELQKRGIEVYCPLKTVVKQYSDRRKKVQLPLINSYIFVNISEKQYREVLTVPGVVRYVYWCGKPAIIKEKEIQEMKLWLDDFDHDQISILEISLSDQVHIQSGPFKDFEAAVTKINGDHIELYLLSMGMKIRTKLSQTLLAKAV